MTILCKVDIASNTIIVSMDLSLDQYVDTRQISDNLCTMDQAVKEGAIELLEDFKKKVNAIKPEDIKIKMIDV